MSSLLPNEVWDLVLGYVTKRDLKALRLTGRWHLGNLASPKLFTTAYIAARRGVIDALAGLANHSTLRHHVKVFIFDSFYLNPDIHGEPSGNDWSKVIEVVHEDKLLALAFANQEYIQTCELRPTLEYALKAFPNIEKVFYAESPYLSCLPGDMSDRCMSISGSHQLDLSRCKFRERDYSCCLAEECGRKHSNFYRRQYSGLTTLLEVIQELDLSRVSELSLGSSDAATYAAGIPDFFFSQNLKTIDPLLKIIMGLRKLDISMSFLSLSSNTLHANAGQSTANIGHEFAGLRRVLASAEKLEELYLSGEVNVASLSLENVWPDGAVGSLKTLRLRTTEASYTKLSKLIWCYKHTLKLLELDDFNLLTEGWPAISKFAQLHAPGLTVVYGYTWFQGITRSITWSPHKKAASAEPPSGDAVADEIDGNDEDSEESPYSDGDDFVLTRTVVGYQRKRRRLIDPQTDESEYEDEIIVSKELKDESDDGSLEYDSGDEEGSDASDLEA